MPRPKRSQETLLEDALNNTFLEPVRKNKKKKTLTYERVILARSSPQRPSAGSSRVPPQSAQMPNTGNEPGGYQTNEVQLHNVEALPEKGKVGFA